APRRPAISGRAALSGLSACLACVDLSTRRDVVKLKQIEHTLEREGESCRRSAFRSWWRLDYHFKDNSNLYMVLEFVNGGEMFLPTRAALEVLRGAQIVLGFEYLHSLDLIYRDLKPENLLIDSTANIKVTDFGFASGSRAAHLDSVRHARPWTGGLWRPCLRDGSRLPAVLRRSANPDLREDRLRQGALPSHFSSDLKDLLRNLLQVDLTKRFGNLKNGVNDIKSQ
uniref:Protein kinase domain-containing protein n=1 Tax=Macrostomum lignano TaxID=282301 RepID=A0A1I8FQQ5_9PLAT